MPVTTRNGSKKSKQNLILVNNSTNKSELNNAKRITPQKTKKKSPKKSPPKELETNKKSKTKKVKNRTSDKNKCPCNCDYPKGLQSTEEKIRWIKCDRCSQWWHSQCTGLSDKLFTIIETFDEVYFCPICVHDELKIESAIFSKEKSDGNILVTKIDVQDTKVADIKNCQGNLSPTFEARSLDNKPTENNSADEVDSKHMKQRSEFCDKFVVIIDGLLAPLEFRNSQKIKQELNKYFPNHKWPFVYILHRGGIAIHCENQEVRDEVLHFAWPKEAFQGSGTEIHCHPPHTTNRVVLKNVPVNISNTELRREIFSQTSVKCKEIHRHKYVDTGKLLPVVTISTESQTEASELLQSPILIGNQSVNCTQYRNKHSLAVRCFRCHRFGHTAVWCMNSETCVNCGGGHNSKLCVNKTHCINCGGGHRADSGLCKSFIRLCSFKKEC